eukprot:m.202473 g.202473  ORF g.202473 m.202473 type:complete len:210 (-) comp16874_c1_seq3:2558-3187(-)
MKKRAFLTLMGKGRDARGRADQDQDGILPPGHSVVSSPRSPVFYHDVCFSYQIQASSLLSISTMEKAIASVVSGAVAVFGLACIFTVLTRPSVNECDMTYMYPNYLPVEGPAHPRYNLFIYKERQQHYQLKGRPVLFIPGHLGSFQQVRMLNIASTLNRPFTALRLEDRQSRHHQPCGLTAALSVLFRSWPSMLVESCGLNCLEAFFTL